MSRHTAGPWFVREIDLLEGGKGVEVVAGDGEVICDNQTYYPQALDPRNARLIAAAPELLEALSTLLNMDVKGHRLGDRLQFSTPGRKILDKCNSAIAKALGEDQ